MVVRVVVAEDSLLMREGITSVLALDEDLALVLSPHPYQRVRLQVFRVLVLSCRRRRWREWIVEPPLSLSSPLFSFSVDVC